MQDDEEDYNEIGTEPINLGEPNIVDQDDSLDAVADEKIVTGITKIFGEGR
ncbi:hypothetical protein NIA73_01240 [Anaerobutyricum hallii]|nr:hypothetical protein [Anaerobutyricum hallii]